MISTTGKEFADHLKSMSKDAKGSYEGLILTWENVFEILAGKDLRMLQCITETLSNIQRRPVKDGLLCLTCQAEFNCEAPPFALFVLRPFAKKMRAVMCSGLCLDCFGHIDREQRILERMRTIMPDARYGSTVMQ